VASTQGRGAMMQLVGPEIVFKDVLEIVKEHDANNYTTTKKQILEDLNLEVTKGNLHLLTSAIKEMKKQKMISTVYGYAENSYLCGRGYVPYEEGVK